MYCEFHIFPEKLSYQSCFNRALCIVNFFSENIKGGQIKGFNRALCIVNKILYKYCQTENLVLIEHYVL